MTTSILPAHDATTVATSERALTSGLTVTTRRVIRSEWIKLRTVRSNVIGFASALFVAVGFGVIFSAIAGSGGEAGPPGLADAGPVGLSLAGLNVAYVIIGVLGTLAVTSEYSTGLIHSTFAAVTRRLPVLWAKVAVIGTVTFVVMAVGALLALLLGQAAYTGDGATRALTDPEMLRVLGGAAFSTAAIAVMGVALGFVLRSSSAAIGVLVATLFVAPLLAGLIPGSIGDTITMWLPSNAASAVTSLDGRADLLSPGAGFGVLCAWVVVLLVGATVSIRRRDA